MNIIVCIKQVPDITEMRWDPETGSLIREGIPTIINPCDKSAIEAALQLRGVHGGKVTALSMGPPQVEEALREALGMGVDEAVQLTGKEFAGSDTLATSRTLGLAIEKIGKYDLIICGKEAIDGMTAQVGPQLAEYLKIPQLTYVTGIEIDNDRVKVTQQLDDYRRILSSPLPALITVEKDAYPPRVAPLDCILESYSKEILFWGATDLSATDDYFGLRGSPTRLGEVYTIKLGKGRVQLFEGAPEDIATQFVEKLKEKYFI